MCIERVGYVYRKGGLCVSKGRVVCIEREGYVYERKGGLLPFHLSLLHSPAYISPVV